MLGCRRCRPIRILPSILFAFALPMPGAAGKPLLNLIDLVAQVFFRMVRIVMYVSPLGAFGGMAFSL